MEIRLLEKDGSCDEALEGEAHTERDGGGDFPAEYSCRGRLSDGSVICSVHAQNPEK